MGAEQNTDSSTHGRRYWFAAKRWGIGWGAPETWEGWTVLIAFLAVAVGDGLVTLPHSHSEPATPSQLAAFAAILALDISAFFVVVLKTGMPIRRHFGKDKG